MVPEIRKVGPRVTRSRMRRVFMTTLWAATTIPFPPRCLENEGSTNRVEEGPNPPNFQAPNPKDRKINLIHTTPKTQLTEAKGSLGESIGRWKPVGMYPTKATNPGGRLSKAALTVLGQVHECNTQHWRAPKIRYAELSTSDRSQRTWSKPSMSSREWKLLRQSRQRLRRGTNVQQIGWACLTSQGLNLMVRNAIPCCYCCGSNLKAVAGKIALNTRCRQNAMQPWSQ